MDKTNLNCTLYGIFQIELKARNLLKEDGTLIRSSKQSETIKDTYAIYSYFREKVKDFSKKYINASVTQFNDISKTLHDDYLLNMGLLGVFIAELYLEDASYIDKQIYLPKVRRLSQYAQGTVKLDIRKDSKIAADNVYRKFTGKLEVTKEIRTLRSNRWKRT